MDLIIYCMMGIFQNLDDILYSWSGYLCYLLSAGHVHFCKLTQCCLQIKVHGGNMVQGMHDTNGYLWIQGHMFMTFRQLPAIVDHIRPRRGSPKVSDWLTGLLHSGCVAVEMGVLDGGT